METKKQQWIRTFFEFSKKYGQQCNAWCIKLLFSQLFLTLFSLPILLWWGLPLSALTVVGNVIFNPFIGLFLFFSSLLFFCELVHLPSGIIVWSLEHLSNVWLQIISYGNRSALIAVPKPPLLIALSIAVAACYCLWRYRLQEWQGVKMLSLLLLASVAGLKFFCVPRSSCFALEYGSRTIMVVHQGARCCIVDTIGVLRSGNQSSSWVDFTLRPYLVSRLGRVTCDAILLMHPTYARMQAAVEIAQKMRIFLIAIPDDKYCKAFDALFFTSPIKLVKIPPLEFTTIEFEKNMHHEQCAKLFKCLAKAKKLNSQKTI